MLVHSIFRTYPYIGNLLGVEIEAELSSRIRRVPEGWNAVGDGSLNSETGVEFVTKTPEGITPTYRKIERLLQEIKDSNSKFLDTVRAGVHVHLNVNDISIKQLYNIICLYVIFEDVLVEWCGDSRVGNLFCLRCTDAQAWRVPLIQFVHTLNPKLFANEDFRYAALNTTALPKYGTLEFRAMKSTDDVEALRTWIYFIWRLKKAALEFNDPIEIVRAMSELGAVGFAKKVFNKRAGLLLANPNFEKLLWRGVRNSQDLAYATTKWEALDAPAPKK